MFNIKGIISFIFAKSPERKNHTALEKVSHFIIQNRKCQLTLLNKLSVLVNPYISWPSNEEILFAVVVEITIHVWF